MAHPIDGGVALELRRGEVLGLFEIALRIPPPGDAALGIRFRPVLTVLLHLGRIAPFLGGGEGGALGRAGEFGRDLPWKHNLRTFPASSLHDAWVAAMD